MKRWLRLGVVFALVVAVAPPSGVSAPALRPPSLRLFDLTTARGIVADKPFQPTQVFAPDDDAVYVWYAADGCALGTTIRSIWFYLETDPPLRLAEGSVTVDRIDNWGQFNFRPAPGKRWAVGRYRIELRVGDDLLAETTFDVSAARPSERQATHSAATSMVARRRMGALSELATRQFCSALSSTRRARSGSVPAGTSRLA